MTRRDAYMQGLLKEAARVTIAKRYRDDISKDEVEDMVARLEKHTGKKFKDLRVNVGTMSATSGLLNMYNPMRLRNQPVRNAVKLATYTALAPLAIPAALLTAVGGRLSPGQYSSMTNAVHAGGRRLPKDKLLPILAHELGHAADMEYGAATGEPPAPLSGFTRKGRRMRAEWAASRLGQVSLGEDAPSETLSKALATYLYRLHPRAKVKDAGDDAHWRDELIKHLSEVDDLSLPPRFRWDAYRQAYTRALRLTDRKRRRGSIDQVLADDEMTPAEQYAMHWLASGGSTQALSKDTAQ
jgi:hypothetical protein